MGIEHIQMPLVGGQVDRFTDHAAGMVQPGNGLVQLHQPYKILVRGVTAHLVQILHKGRPPGRAEDRGRAAHPNRVGRVAGVLRELRRCGRSDGLAAKTGLKTDPFVLHVAACLAEYLQNFGVVAELHPGVAQDRIGILFDQAQTFLAQDVEGAQFAINKGRARQGLTGTSIVSF